MKRKYRLYSSNRVPATLTYTINKNHQQFYLANLENDKRLETIDSPVFSEKSGSSNLNLITISVRVRQHWVKNNFDWMASFLGLIDLSITFFEQTIIDKIFPSKTKNRLHWSNRLYKELRIRSKAVFCT